MVILLAGGVHLYKKQYYASTCIGLECRQLGLARVFGMNDCYPPHPGSIPVSDMLSS
jgi:hypothetical protein